MTKDEITAGQARTNALLALMDAKIAAFINDKTLAEKGDREAQHSLANCYEKGDGVSCDRDQAFSWYRKAAEQGLAQAQNSVGNCYNSGEGVAKDQVQAVMWYRKAAEQGLAQAQLNLGLCYEEGDGVEKDETTAVLWYLMAAEQGHVPALDRVGLCYAARKGVYTIGDVKEYDVEAYAYWSLVRMANETAIRERSPLWHVWTAKQGHTVDAKFCALDGDVITIQKRDGQTLNISAGIEKEGIGGGVLSLMFYGKNINDDKWVTSAFPAVADPSSTTFFGYPNNYKSYGLMVNYSF